MGFSAGSVDLPGRQRRDAPDPQRLLDRLAVSAERGDEGFLHVPLRQRSQGMPPEIALAHEHQQAVLALELPPGGLARPLDKRVDILRVLKLSDQGRLHRRDPARADGVFHDRAALEHQRLGHPVACRALGDLQQILDHPGHEGIAEQLHRPDAAQVADQVREQHLSRAAQELDLAQDQERLLRRHPRHLDRIDLLDVFQVLGHAGEGLLGVDDRLRSDGDGDRRTSLDGGAQRGPSRRRALAADPRPGDLGEHRLDTLVDGRLVAEDHAGALHHLVESDLEGHWVLQGEGDHLGIVGSVVSCDRFLVPGPEG